MDQNERDWEGDVNKRGILLSLELSMLATARKYDVEKLEHRRHSTHALSKLFFDLSAIAGIDLFVEAGAKQAEASRRARRWFPKARVVAFEASPLNYQEYVQDVTAAGVEYFNCACTEASGPVTFNMHRDEQGAPIANGQASLLERDRAPVDRERGFEPVTVEGIALDDFFKDHEFEGAALWIDVEGACNLVLPGARALLERTSVLMIEVEEKRYWGKDHWIRGQVVSYLYDLGLVPVARDYEYLHQHNIVFVRSDLLEAPNGVSWALEKFVSRSVDPPRRARPKSASGSAARPQVSAGRGSGPAAIWRRAKRLPRRVRNAARRA